MSPSPSAQASARRNLVWRIDEFLRKQMAMPAFALTGWQADQVQAAIDLLDADQFAEGERTMMQVEKAAIFEPAGYKPVNRSDVGQLIERLAQVAKG